MKEKNYSIEFYRVVATLIICFHHFQSKVGIAIISYGFLMVEFFFILSGIFIAQKFESENCHSGSKYFIGRVKRIYPEYILAAVIGIVSYSVIGKFDISKAISEVLMLQNTGLFMGGYNYPCWYISVLVVMSFILYECLKHFKNTFVSVIIPLIVVGGYGYILNGFSEDYGFVWSTQGFIHIPMLRGLCGLSLGIFIFYLSQCSFIHGIKRWLATATEIICLVIIVVGLVTNIFKIQVVGVAVATLLFVTYSKLGFIGSKLLNHKWISYISNYSFSLYLNHGIIANTLDFVNRTYLHLGKQLMIIYLVFVIVYSVITHNIISLLLKKLSFNQSKRVEP